MSRVIHFEIQATDAARASTFYKNVFGWQFTKWEGPEAYWMITTGEETDPGINGGLLLRPVPKAPEKKAAVNAFVCSIEVVSLKETHARIIDEGGLNVVPQQAIPGMGWQAYYKDTEGNLFGVTQLDPAAK